MAVLTLRPNADSTPLEQSSYPSSPTTHYDKIDEVTLSATDYCACSRIDAGTIEKTDIYGFPDHTSESGTINSVKVLCQAKWVVVGTDNTASYIAPAVKIGSSVYASSYQTLTNSTAEYSYTWTTNPDTSSAWTWDEIDSLLAGDKQKSHTVDKSNYKVTYCYQLWVEVDYTAGGAGSLPLKNVFGRPFSGVFR